MSAEEIKAKHEKKVRTGLMFMLSLAFAAAMFGYGYALYHVGLGVENAEYFGLEMSGLAVFYATVATWAFAFPVLAWGAALLITKAGKVQRSIGSMLAVFLFAFSVLWPAGAVVAFLEAYDPPRRGQPDSGLSPEP